MVNPTKGRVVVGVENGADEGVVALIHGVIAAEQSRVLRSVFAKSAPNKNAAELDETSRGLYCALIHAT